MKTIRIFQTMALLALLLCLFVPGAHAAPLDDCAAGRHQYEEIRRIPATAMEDGEVEYLCSVCGRRITETLFATNHLWGPWVIDKPATCTQPGARRRTCTRGERHDETAVIPALGHDYKETVVEPGCEAPGEKIYKCTRCGDTYTEPIPALGHDYKEIVKEPSCLEPGLKTFVCANDPSHTYDEEIPAIGSHDFGEWETKTLAGEGVDGMEKRACIRCGFEETRTLEALPVPATEQPTEPPKPLPVVDIVLVGANTVSLGFFAFLLIPYFLCLIYLKKRREAVERRDALRREWEERYGSH